MKRGILVGLIAAVSTFYLSLQLTSLEDLVPREKLSSIINSEYQEVRPLISPDGMTLYFSRRNHPDNFGGERDFQDIWLSHYIDGEWSVPTNFGGPINNKKANTLCSITGDGHYALLLDSYKRVKTSVAQVYDSPAGWGAPGDLVIQDFTNLSAYYDFYYQEQSMVLLMAIDDGRGAGEQDLQVSFKQEDGSYSRPKNLGPIVNTGKADFAPFLAADGKTLYFASFGHKGLGGSDLYVTQRLDESWKRWSEPKNLGPGINSEQDENYLSVTGDFSYVYFESYPHGSKEKDIYRAPLPQQFHPQYLAPQQEAPTSEFVATDSKPRPNTQSPSYTPTIESDEQLSSALREEKSETPFLGNLATRQYFQEGQVKSKVLNNTYFLYNSYQLSPDCISKLKEISKVLHSNPRLEVQIEGYADSWGTNKSNLRISYLRAQAAAHYLLDQGVLGQRLLVDANGEEKPLASNDDEKDGRELNRRVEITLINSAEVYNQGTRDKSSSEL